MKLNYPTKNVFKTVILTVVCILISFSLFLQGSAVSNSVDLDWKVSIGETKMFTISNLFEEMDNDENGDPSSVQTRVIDTNNNTVEVLLMEGSTFTVEVIDLKETARIQITFDNNVTTKPRLDNGHFLQKTTNDRSYWGQVAKDNAGCFVSGDLFTLKQTISGQESIKKYNMTSGWLEYSQRSYDNSVEEITALGYQVDKVSFDFLLSFLGILIVAVIVRNKEIISK